MQATLNVLTVIDHLALGGAEMMLGRFAAGAPGAGIRLSVTCLSERDGNPAAAPLRAVGIEPVVLGINRLRLSELRQLKHHIAEARPDIVHTHLGSSDCLGATAARSLGIPAVSTIHAMEWSGSIRTRVQLELSACARRRGAARIIAVSESARRAYLTRGWGPAERVVTIRNGLDLVPAAGEGAAIRREFGFEPGDLVIGMVSALRPEKAHDVAIATFARLREDFPRLRLLIAGEGASRDEIARLAAPHGAAVVMAGSRSDVMAASVAVVGTDVGGIPEIVDDGTTGVLVRAPPAVEPVARALAHVLGDAALRRELGAAGRRRYENEFQAGPWVQGTRSLYDEVLAEVGATTTPRHGAAR